MAKTKRRPIRFISIILLVWCVLLGLTAALLLFSSGEAERGLEETLNVRVEQARDRQETLLNNIYLTSRNILGNVMYDSDIGEILQRAPRGDAQSIRTMRNKLRLTQNIHMNDIEYRVVLLDLNGNLYANWQRGSGYYDEIMSYPVVQDAIASRQTFFMLKHPFWHVDDENPIERVPSISFGNVVENPYQAEVTGVLLFSAEEKSLVSALETDGQVAVTNALTGERLCGSVEDALYRHVQEHPADFPLGVISRITWRDREMLVCRSRVASSNLELLHVMLFDDMYRELISLRHVNLAVLLTALAVMACVLVLLTLGLSRPLRRLYQQVGDLSIREDGEMPMITVQGYRECAEVAEAINDMSKRTMEMVDVIQRQEKERAELKYRYLLSQLDPHFLLNTLNNVKWTAYMSGAPRVAEMIMALGFLLETSLGKNQGEVTIDYEISHVRSYMLLQSMHYGEDVSCDISAENETRTLPFERLTLQTLVGNAIKHGYQKGSHLHIDIRIALEGERLCIAVSDNGQGMSPERLEEVRQELRESESQKRSSHIGLRNLCQRLAYRYKGRAVLTVESEQDEGTQVVLTVPLECLQSGRKDDRV